MNQAEAKELFINEAEALQDLTDDDGNPGGNTPKTGEKASGVPDSAVSVSDESEIPEDAQKIEGPRGGTYYVEGAGDADMDDLADAMEAVAEGNPAAEGQVDAILTHAENEEQVMEAIQEMPPEMQDEIFSELDDDEDADQSNDGWSKDQFDELEKTEQVDTNVEIDNIEEEFDIAEYMSGAYERINDELRRPGSQLSDDVQEYKDTLEKYIDKAGRFDEPTTVHRGMAAPPELADKLRESEGEDIQLSGFQSASHDPDVANVFTGAEEGEPVMMSIETERGLPTYALDSDDFNTDEEEVVLGHDWTYEVENVEETGDGLHVEATAVMGWNQ